MLHTLTSLSGGSARQVSTIGFSAACKLHISCYGPADEFFSAAEHTLSMHLNQADAKITSDAAQRRAAQSWDALKMSASALDCQELVLLILGNSKLDPASVQRCDSQANLKVEYLMGLLIYESEKMIVRGTRPRTGDEMRGDLSRQYRVMLAKQIIQVG